MLINFIIYSLGSAFILFFQTMISKTIDRSIKTGSSFKIDYLPIFIFSIFFGLFFSIGNRFLDNYINYKIFIVIITASLISSYWFFVAPVFYMFKKNKYIRDLGLENEIQLSGFKYKILFSDEISLNAYCTGGLPHLRLIIIANNLKLNLNADELKAVIYHEIGHHEKKHILKLFFINIVIYTIYYLMFDYLFSLKLNQLYEILLVVLVGACGGLMFYYIPNKILYYLEYEADRFSAKHFNKKLLISALIKFDNLTNGELTKGNINHPNLAKRLKNLEK